MKLTEEVQSSNIKKIGYENNTLFVEYMSGVRYAYKNVPESLYEDFKKAESKGRFMNEYVKPKFEYEKIV